MATIATLAVKLIADAGAYISAMDQAESKTKTWSANVSKNLKDAGGSMVDAGKKATTFLTLPILTAGAAAISYASDLEETKSKVNVVFGAMSKDVLTWSADSATAIGMSREQALAAAGTYGNLFVSLGLGQKPAADMSTSLVDLAADLASFNNADPSDVLLALRSGLSGEIEPLKKFGIAINESILKAKAMELGLGDNLQVLSEAEKLQIRYAIIMDQTATAQGDFARTSEGLANQQRILKAQLADSAAVLGAQLLPYALQFVQWLSQAITWLQQLTPEQQKWVLGLLAAVAVIGPLLMVVGSLVTAIGAIVGVIGAITTPVLIVIAVIAALIAIGYLLYQAWINNWGGIQEKTAAVIAFVQGLIQGGMQFIEDLTTGKLGAVSAIWNNTFAFIQLYIENFVAIWKAIFSAFAAAAQGDWYTFGSKMREAFDVALKTVGALIQTSWSNIKTAFSALVTNILSYFKSVDWGEVGMNILRGIGNGMMGAIPSLIGIVSKVGSTVMSAFKGFWGIKSPAVKPRREVGYPIGQGQGLGIIDGLVSMIPQLNMAANNMLTRSMPELSAPQASPLAGFAPTQKESTEKSLSIGPIHIVIEGNADEDNVREGVSFGIGDALRASGKA